MRFLIFILLLSLGTDAQIIRANPFYRATAASCSYLLDQYSGASAAYALRKLDCDYSGSAIRVRRSSDNAESDIGFIGEYLDTVTLKAFCTNNIGTVVTWYDPSGNGRDATQPTNSAQPIIVEAGGAINRVNGEPALNMGTQGDPKYLLIPTGFLNGTTALSYFQVGLIQVLCPPYAFSLFQDALILHPAFPFLLLLPFLLHRNRF